MSKRSQKDRARPGILEAISGAERVGLPNVTSEAWGKCHMALRTARDAVSGEAHPVPCKEAVRSALVDVEEAFKRTGYATPEGSPAWLIRSAVESAVAFATSDLDGASAIAAKVRRYVRERDAADAERDRQDTLLAYQEAFRAIRAGEAPVKVESGDGERRVEVEVLGLRRACGGVVISHDRPELATVWLARARQHHDPYVQDLARKVERAYVDAAKSAA